MPSLWSGQKAGGLWLWHFHLEKHSRVRWWAVRKTGEPDSPQFMSCHKCQSLQQPWTLAGSWARGQRERHVASQCFHAKAMIKNLALNFPVLWWCWRPAVLCMHPRVATGKPGYVIQKIWAKCWEDLSFSRPLEWRCLWGPLFSRGGLTAPWTEAKHIHNNQNKKNRVQLSSKKDMSENRVNSWSHSSRVIPSTGQCPSAPPLLNMFAFLSLKIT